MKTILLLLITTFIITQTSIAQTHTVKGVVTYFFNKYQGDKPDVGAKIYAIDSSIFHKEFKTIDSFQLVSAYKNIYETNDYIADTYKKLVDKTKGKKKQQAEYDNYLSKYNEAIVDMDKYKLKLMEYNAWEKKDYDALDSRSMVALYTAKSESNPSTTVDGAGNYSLNLNPNIYYIVIISNNRKRLSLSEINGSYKIKKIDLNKVNQTEFSTKFDL